VASNFESFNWLGSFTPSLRVTSLRVCSRPDCANEHRGDNSSPTTMNNFLNIRIALDQMPSSVQSKQINRLALHRNLGENPVSRTATLRWQVSAPKSPVRKAVVVQGSLIWTPPAVQYRRLPLL